MKTEKEIKEYLEKRKKYERYDFQRAYNQALEWVLSVNENRETV